MPKTLTAAEIAELADSPNTEGYDDGKFWIAPNLYIQVVGNSASWLMRFTQRGKHRAMGLGPVRNGPSLTQAKRLVTKYMTIVHEGGDPVAARRAELGRTGLPGRTSSAPTFRKMAREFIAYQEPRWRDPYAPIGWRNRLNKYVYPTIGDLPVDEITVDHLVEILQPLHHAMPPTAVRIRSHVERILDWAIAHGHRGEPNPAAWSGALPIRLGGPVRHETKHHPAIPYPLLPEFWKKLRADDGTPARVLAFQMLTAVRPGEALGADWAEIDSVQRVWTIPASRMKKNREHRIPLSDAAIALLKEMSPAAFGLVFPSKTGGQTAGTALGKLIHRLGYKGSPHGMRSAFADWSREVAGADRETRELALAHREHNPVVSAYSRSDLLEPRRALMQAWSDYVTGVESDG